MNLRLVFGHTKISRTREVTHWSITFSHTLCSPVEPPRFSGRGEQTQRQSLQSEQTPHLKSRFPFFFAGGWLPRRRLPPSKTLSLRRAVGKRIRSRSLLVRSAPQHAFTYRQENLGFRLGADVLRETLQRCHRHGPQSVAGRHFEELVWLADGLHDKTDTVANPALAAEASLRHATATQSLKAVTSSRSKKGMNMMSLSSSPQWLPDAKGPDHHARVHDRAQAEGNKCWAQTSCAWVAIRQQPKSLALHPKTDPPPHLPPLHKGTSKCCMFNGWHAPGLVLADGWRVLDHNRAMDSCGHSRQTCIFAHGRPVASARMRPKKSAKNAPRRAQNQTTNKS